MKTIKEVIGLSTDYLAKAGLESSRVDAEWLVGYALGLQRMELYLQFDRPLSEDELSKIRPLLARRAKNEPVQYICGSTEFYGLELKVGPGVLVPRPETELLVDNVLKKLPDSRSVLDLCTGSGAIAIALKKEHPELEVTATDISAEALKYAQVNSAHHELEIELLEGDLFTPVKDRMFDAITVNPPYVKPSEKPLMGKDVLAHEPELALFSGEDGLDLLRRIAAEGRNYLNEGGFLISEIGFQQGEDCKSLFSSHGWTSVNILQDYTKKDRFVLCYV